MISEKLLADIRSYYHYNAAGGSLHIVLDDGNIEDSSVRWCYEFAKKEKDLPAVRIAKQLLTLSVAERQELYDRYSEYQYL